MMVVLPHTTLHGKSNSAVPAVAKLLADVFGEPAMSELLVTEVAVVPASSAAAIQPSITVPEL